MRLRRLSPPWKILLCMGLTDLIFTVPVVIAYFQFKGVDLAGALALQGLMRLAVMLFEVPTGYLADRWQRRHTLLLGAVLWVLGMMVLWQATSFYGLALAQITIALAIACYSGTLQAFMHEALRAEGRLAEEAKWQGRLYAASLIPCMLAALVGGWLYTLSPHAPVIATIVSGLLGVALTFMLPNLPREAAERRHRNPFYDLWLIARASMRGSGSLCWLLFGPTLLISLTEVFYWVLQGKLVALGTSSVLLGIAIALYNGVAAVGALYLAERLKLWPRRRFLLVIASLLLPAGLMMLSNSLWFIIGGGLIGGLINALTWPWLITAINQDVPDHERATTLSLGSFYISLQTATMLFLAPLSITLMGLNATILGFTALILGLAAYPLWRLWRAS